MHIRCGPDDVDRDGRGSSLECLHVHCWMLGWARECWATAPVENGCSGACDHHCRLWDRLDVAAWKGVASVIMWLHRSLQGSLWVRFQNAGFIDWGAASLEGFSVVGIRARGSACASWNLPACHTATGCIRPGKLTSWAVADDIRVGSRRCALCAL